MSIIEKVLEKEERQRRAGEPDAVPEALDPVPEPEAAPAPETAAEAPAADAKPGSGNGAAAPQDAPRVRAKGQGRTAKFDLKALSEAGFVTPDSPQGLLSEELRVVKRSLLMNCSAPDQANGLGHVNLMMVTSALPSEGKTFITLNLAMSIAMEVDRTVLLVDTDVAKADITRMLGLAGEPGLTDVLRGAARVEEVLVQTNVPKLTVLPAGRPNHHVSEFFASESMARLAAELSERYSDRVVLFDTMPLLAGSGASTLAPYAGQIVLVVEAVRTAQTAVQEGLRLLRRFSRRSDHIGLVLNKSREARRGGYYYGYYGVRAG